MRLSPFYFYTIVVLFEITLSRKSNCLEQIISFSQFITVFIVVARIVSLLGEVRVIFIDDCRAMPTYMYKKDYT